MEISFVTSNEGKVRTLKNFLKLMEIGNVEVVSINLDIIEPQLESVIDIAKYKALRAYEILKKPVLVEDSGMAFDALNGFPGSYAKYAVDKLGAKGFMKLLEGETNRVARFIGCAVFIDENGKMHYFLRKGGKVDIAEYICDIDSPYAWSELWKIIYIKEYDKMFCQLTGEEVSQYVAQMHSCASIPRFVRWFKYKYGK